MVQRTALMRNFKRDTDLIGSRFKNLLVRHNDKLCVIVFIVLDRLVEHFQTINIRSQGACDRCLVLFPILFDLLGGHRVFFRLCFSQSLWLSRYFEHCISACGWE